MRSKSYKVKVTYDAGWYVGEVAGLRAFTGGKGGVITQGRDLDELAFMVRDAVALLTDETDIALQLLLPATLKAPRRRAGATKKRAKRAA